MRPTKEIIELSKKLYELGYKKEIKEGDWFRTVGDTVDLWDTRQMAIYSEHDDCLYFSVPSLEDGLRWLRNKGLEYQLSTDYPSLDNKGKVVGDDLTVRYYCRWCAPHDPKWNWVKNNDPHVAVLKAIIKVLEEK